MPKKSRKEKIIAELRRRVQTQQSLTVQIPTLVKEEVSPAFTFRAKKDIYAPVQHAEQNATELTAIKRDLYKTFILATVAILAEIIIYFVKR